MTFLNNLQVTIANMSYNSYVPYIYKEAYVRKPLINHLFGVIGISLPF